MTATTKDVRVYWIPGCANCVRVKGYLKQRGVDYRAVNVQDDLEAVEEMKAAGIIGLPVVRVGNRYAPGADLAQVDDLLGLSPDPSKRVLLVDELVPRSARILDVAASCAEQIPAGHHNDVIPGMEDVCKAFIYMLDGSPYIPHRTYRALVGHIVGHARKFDYFARSAHPDGDHDVVFAATQGEFSAFGEPAPETSMARMVEELRVVARDIRAFAPMGGEADVTEVVETFYGDQTVHQVMQTMTCSLAQHTRQLRAVLDSLGIRPSRTLATSDLEGLVIPADVWD